MNKVAKTGIAAVCLWTLCTWAAAHAVQRIGAFHSDIRIAASGELSVTETIEVQATGREPHRGLVREFPRVKAPLAVEKVLRNGQPEPYRVERVSSGTRVRTGERGRVLPRGKHVYQIVYRTARRIGFFDQHDELRWNVAGGLASALERLSAEVSFERAVPAERMKLDAHTGAAGARGQDYHAFVREGSAAFRATRPLAPREGMTIVVAFPKGVVERPALAERGAAYLSANPGVPVGAGILALMLALLFACRSRFGRKRQGLPSSIPPQGVGPGGVRFIDRAGYDERCLTAALLGLQSRGYLRIREHGERFGLERGAEEVEWFAGEQALVRRLLRDKHAEMRRHGRAVEEAGRAFSRELRRAFGRRAWSESGSFTLAAAGIGLAGVLAMVALETPHAAIAVLGAAMLVALALFSVKLAPVYRARGSEHQGDIDALRRYLSSAEPGSAEEFSRLLPYAVALGLESPWGRRYAELVPASMVELTAKAPDKAPARPRRPLRHTRSAAA